MKRSKRTLERQQRGRRIVMWGLAAVALAQIATGLLLDYKWSGVRFPRADTILARWHEASARPDIVFFGSSRFEGGVWPEVIDADLAKCFAPAPHCFNAALPGGDPIVADWFLQKIFTDGYRPKLLVLEVSPETVATSAWFLEWQVQRLFTWGDWVHGFVPIVRCSHLTRVLASRVVPLYHYRYEIRKQTRNAVVAWATPTPEQKAAAPAVTPVSAGNWTRTPAEAGLTAPTPPQFANVPLPENCGDLPRWLRNYKVGGLEGEAFERLLKRCQEQQIAVVLVGVPVSGLHRSLYTPEIDRAFLDYMKQLTATYPCCFIDLRERVPDCCFCDHHHISQQGREFVSRLLAWEVVLPAWRELRGRPANKSY